MAAVVASRLLNFHRLLSRGCLVEVVVAAWQWGFRGAEGYEFPSKEGVRQVLGGPVRRTFASLTGMDVPKTQGPPSTVVQESVASS